MASAETPVQYTRFHADWLAYETAKDHQVAAECLERCLADSAILDSEGRSNLIAEATVFNACWREDRAKAEGWSKRALSARQLGPLDRIRIEVAVFYSRGEFDEALTALARGFSMIQSAPSSKERSKCEAGWVVWRDQIEQRILVQ
jgi:tetratricopeptide (TPR) repeat protein